MCQLGNCKQRSQRQWVRLQLKAPIKKTIGQSLGNESLEEKFCILGIP